MENNIDPADLRVLYAKLGETVSDPKALAQWRRDPKKYHAEQKQNKATSRKESAYNEEVLDEMLRRWDRQPEIQMQAVFTDLVRQAQRAFRTTLTFSGVTFTLGITIVAVTFVIEVAYLLGLIQGVKWEQALAGGGVLAGLGIGSIVTVFVRGPARQVQNAVSDLAQIEVAFLSFIAQSRGIDFQNAQSLDDTERLVTLLSKLRSETMADIEKYLEKPDEHIKSGSR